MVSGYDDPDSLDDGANDEPSLNGDEPPSDDTRHSARAASRRGAFGPVLPAGFAQSLFRNLDLNPWGRALRSAGAFKIPASAMGLQHSSQMQRLMSQVQGQQAARFRALGPMRAIAEGLQAQQRSVLSNLVLPTHVFEQYRRAFAPYAKNFAELPRLLLPPNLREVSDDITAHDVYEFLEEEGIPLYLIPRATIGRRLILAKDHARRRRVLNDRFCDIVDDCAALIDTCTDPALATEVHFIQDGIGALRAGHHASAQAIFTVTLDTLISRFYPDKETRRKITNRKKDAEMPDAISDMSIRRAYVWLPVWNAHQEFWRHKGDRIPNDYSRHATVHGVSKTQFNKRNCVQALMLASSLVGYANQLVRTQRG